MNFPFDKPDGPDPLEYALVVHGGLALNGVDNWQNRHLYPDHLHSGACALAYSPCKHLQAGKQK